jgi:GlpG protein
VKLLKRISFNSPVVLSFALIALVVLIANAVTAGAANDFLATHKTSWFSPLTYLRLFTGPLAHAGVGHYVGNMVLLLAVGPIVEEKYGSRRLLAMMALTAAITGLVDYILWPGTALVGASGIIFLVILLASFTSVKEGQIPLTFILVALIYIGGEVVAIFQADNVSQFAHIAGGACGSVFGLATRGGQQPLRLPGKKPWP